MAILDGLSIVVVGGTSGLGLSAARACVAAGARVVLVGRDPTKAGQAAEEFGESARIYIGDAANSSTSDGAVALAVKAFGKLDGLYHVAGGSGRSAGDGPLHELTDQGIEITLHWNLNSLIYSNRAAVRAFLRQGTGGTILNMSSVLAFAPSPPYFATHAYAAAKAAVIGFTKSCAAYYARKDIRCNVIAPALVETPMSHRAAADERIRAFVATKQPLAGGRLGLPQDLDGAVVYLLSDSARYVTGQVLAVDGGWSVSEGQIAAD